MAEPRLTMEQILADVEKIAQDANGGAERLRALQFLANREQANVVLPEPMDKAEKLTRLKRVMRGAGPDLCRQAFFSCWPGRIGKLTEPPSWDKMQLSEEDQALVLKIVGLKQLYRYFPEIMPPHGGTPNGFPYGSRLKQMAWCRTQAKKILKERQAEKFNRIPPDQGDTVAETQTGPLASASGDGTPEGDLPH